MKKILICLAIIVLSTVALFAANEMKMPYSTGSNIYAVVRDSSAFVLRRSNSTFEPFGTAGRTVADYNYSMTDANGGLYQASLPVIAAGRYSYQVYLQAGTEPNAGDTLIGIGSIVWNGSEETFPGDVNGPVILSANGLDKLSKDDPNTDPNSWNFRDWLVFGLKSRWGNKTVLDRYNDWFYIYDSNGEILVRQYAPTVDNNDFIYRVESP